jgi:site-specific recombinase XerD
MNKQTIASYKAYLASRGRNTAKPGNHSDKQLAPSTINYKLIALRAYLRYLIDIDYPCPLPPEAVKLLKAVPKQPQIPEFKDLIRLIEAPAPEANIIELRDKAILETLFNRVKSIGVGQSESRASRLRTETTWSRRQRK